MKQFEHKEGKKAELVPFMQYYPTYSSMDKQQKEWYFYWRSQVRKGIYLDTDLSYIFVHVTEMSMFGVMCNLTCPVIFKTDLNFESFEYIGCVSQSFMTDFYSTVQIDKIS